MTACRDDCCPCGSGAAYQVCCLERETSVRRLVAELEGTVRALGRAIWDEDPDWYTARFGELYDGGIEAFGPSGPVPDARLEAELCFLLDCPLDSGETPLHRLRQRANGRPLELLARSALRAWRIESVDGAGVLGALCPLGTGRARLETVRRPLGELTAGAILVARSAPIGPTRWALLGRAPVVDRDAVGDFDALLAELYSPRGEFWRVHGGVLARAAWAWPEDREHTVEGEIVEGALAAFRLGDPAAAVALLEGDAELDRDCGGAGGEGAEGRSGAGGGLVRWNWRWDPPRGRSFPHEPGVRYTLCHEDAAARPFLAQVLVDLDIPEICLLAPTPRRLALAERLLAARLGRALGQLALRAVDPPSVVPRWRRAAFERDLRAVGTGSGGARRAA